MLCSNCGHENPSENRFCGMCGARLDPMAVPQREPVRGSYADLVRERVGAPEKSLAGEPSSEAVLQRIESARLDALRSREPQRRNGNDLEPAASVAPPEPKPQRPRHEKAISGPSFLNLEVPEIPAEGPEDRAKPDQTISGPSFLGLADEGRGYNIDYLLEDEPKESHWRLWLVLIILALFGVMAWLQLRHSGVDMTGLMQRLRQGKLSTTEEQTHPSDVSSDSGATADVAKSPAQNSPAAQNNSSQNDGGAAPVNGSNKAGDQSKNAAQAAADAAKTSDGGADQSKDTAKSDVSADAKSPASATSDSVKQPDKSPENSSAPNPDKSATGSEGNPSATDTAGKNQPTAVAKNTPPKKPAASVEDSEAKAARVRDSQTAGLVASGEKYLYGRGVPANCERAISYLRKASDMGNAKGSSHLGAMYATGQCLPMDRVRAYKYFAQALHQDSSNMYFQRNLEMLWNEMTSEEKQQALARTPAQ